MKTWTPTLKNRKNRNRQRNNLKVEKSNRKKFKIARKLRKPMSKKIYLLTLIRAQSQTYPNTPIFHRAPKHPETSSSARS